MEIIVELETSKFEDYKMEPILFDQYSVKVGDWSFSLFLKQPFRGVSSEVFDFA